MQTAMAADAFRAPWGSTVRMGVARPVAAVLAVAVVLAPVSAAREAEFGPGGVSLAAQVATVSSWAAFATGLPEPEVLPEVVQVSRAALARLRYGNRAAALGGLAKVEALYDREGRRILLADDWDGASVRSLSVLIHEVVHHFEASLGLRPACLAAGERRAYLVQDRWLKRFGSSLAQSFGIDEGTRWLLTHCRGRRRT